MSQQECATDCQESSIIQPETLQPGHIIRERSQPRQPSEFEEYATRAELERRLAQLERRLQFLANGARQQESSMRRMEAALHELQKSAVHGTGGYHPFGRSNRQVAGLAPEGWTSALTLAPIPPALAWLHR